MSKEGENSVAAGGELKDLVPPTFAEDLAPNVKAGFESTCEFILRSHAALTAQIAQLSTRIDALGDAPAVVPAQPPPAAQFHDMVQHRPAENHGRRHVGIAGNGELEADADFPQQQRQFGPPPAALRQAGRVPLEDGGFGRIKLSIPSFSGDRGPEDYLEWEMRMDHIFLSHNYSEEKRLQIAAFEFTGYVLVWWNQILRMRTCPTSWRGMKDLMRHRFVPEHYKRDMYNKLQQLTQGDKSVDEYYKEMELLMIRIGTKEEPEATMSRFFNGLNLDVQDRVEMVTYYDIQDLVHQAQRADLQLKRRQTAAPITSGRPPYIEGSGSISKMAPYTRSSNAAHSEASKSVGSKVASSTPSSSQVECFTCGGRGHMRRACPNTKRVTLTQEGYISASDDEHVDDSPGDASEDHGTDVYAADVALNCTNLMVQRVLADRIEGQRQRWNIFQTQCTVNNTSCKLIIDSGSYTNIVSKSLVDSLSLPTWKHPQPHCVEWLYNSGKLKVTHKARLKISVGNYEDTVVCDVLPMEACQVLLGRPWQFDKRSTHEGRSNVYSLWHQGRRHVLKPMLDKDIHVDALKKKVQHIKAKPRTVSIQVGGDDEGRIATTPDISAPPYILKVGLMCITIPPTAEVKPNFRTPPESCNTGLSGLLTPDYPAPIVRQSCQDARASVGGADI
jgi:hypothetical protein